MMIGTVLFVRSWRQTSIPEMRGSITSSSTRSGRTASNRSSASAPSVATSTRNPSRFSPTWSASTKRLLVLDQQHRGHRAHDDSSLGASRVGDGCGGCADGTSSLPPRRTDGHLARRDWSPRGGRSTVRGRCHRSRGCAPGRPDRSVRTRGRGRARGCRSPWSLDAELDPRRRSASARTWTVPPGSLYLTAFSTRLPRAETSCRRSPATRQMSLGGADADLDPVTFGEWADPLGGVVEDVGDDHRVARPARRRARSATARAGRRSCATSRSASSTTLRRRAGGRRRDPRRPRSSRRAPSTLRPVSSARG